MPKLENLDINSQKITERINAIAYKILKQNKEGISWTLLLSKIKETDPSLHPKTINGSVWKLIERFPDEVYKPSKWIFRLIKYKKSSI